MARSDSALDALPPARQRAFRAYLCGTIFTGAENTRRGRSGNRRWPGGESPECSSLPRGEDAGGESSPRRAARGPGPGRLRAAAGGAAARGFRERGAGAQGPVALAGARARRCPPRPGRGGLGGASSLLGERGGGRAAKPGPEPARTGSGRRGGRERSGRSPGGLEGARRAEPAVSGIPHLSGAQVCGPRGRCEVPIGPGRNCVQAGHSPSTVPRSPKIYNRPKPFLEKSYFPGFRETVITSILNLEGNVHPFQGRKKNVQSRPILGNRGNGVGPVPGVHPLVPSPEHT